jgi:hypothetical protein
MEAHSMNDPGELPEQASTPAAKPYVAPRLEFVGLMTEIVQSGTGKASMPLPDGPDIRKPPGHG